MNRPGFGLKFAAVMNALLLVFAFIGCRGGGLDTSDAQPVVIEEKPYFMSGSKSLLNGSFPSMDQSSATNPNPTANKQGFPQPSNSSFQTPSKSEGAQP
jgi:hypothetical protein